jgi:hypothetical protein
MKSAFYALKQGIFEGGELMKKARNVISVLAGIALAGLILIAPAFVGKAAGHTHDGITFTEWTATDNLPSESGNYYLASDVNYDGEWYIDSGVNINLDLNGKTLTVSRYLTLDGGALSVYDCTTTGRMTAPDTDCYGFIYGSGTFTLNGGTVDASGFDAPFNMYGSASITINDGVVLKGQTDKINCGGKAVTVNNAYLNLEFTDVAGISENTDAYKDAYPYIVGNPNYFNKNSNEPDPETDWLDPLRTQLHIAADPEFGANVNNTADYTGDFALPAEIMQYIKDNPQVTLNYSFYVDDVLRTVTITGKNVVVEEGVLYYGFNYLLSHYGDGSAVTGPTGIYTIVKGDTLTSIAKKFGTTIEALAAKNGIKNVDLIYAGAKIAY